MPCVHDVPYSRECSQCARGREKSTAERVKERLERANLEAEENLLPMQLLEKVYHDIGPYQDGKLTFETWNSVRNFFGFDDSE